MSHPIGDKKQRLGMYQQEVTMFTSNVSGGGNRIGLVCPSVCTLPVKLFDIRTQNLASRCSWTISDMFEGQGHGYKVKVTMLQNVICHQFCMDILI